MESALTKACTIKIQNFEGPFDLLFHLIEKNKINIYDIPVNEITDQYMEYLFAMKEMDLEIASEFLVMAATLLHIKSRLLLPEKKTNKEEEEAVDPREELVLRLLEYKKYKGFSSSLKEREDEWIKVCYKLPEVIEPVYEIEPLELDPSDLKSVYLRILTRNEKKINKTVTSKITQIIQHEAVSLKGKMREVLRGLLNSAVLKFTDLFSLKKRSRAEIVTGFLAILELSKLKKVTLEQEKQFEEILIYRKSDESDNLE
ncbi:MAG TPA: segregation/condensation protein A [Clostridia bacterium]